VIDDGSTDGSHKIAERFPIRYIRQENRGLSDARNTGIRESKGDYLVFLDADDRLKPQAIARGLRALDTRPDCAMSVGDHVFIAADGSHLANSVKPFDVHHHFEMLLKSNFIEMISTVLFRRSVVEEVGGFDPTLRVAEDYDLYLRIARLHPICSHTAIVAEYRKHGTNTSLNSELMLITTLRVLKSQARYSRHNFRRLLAYCEGIRTWRKQYGRQLATELAGGHLRIPALRHKLLILTTYYPQGLLLLGYLWIMRGMGQQRRVRSSEKLVTDLQP
jgi:glycosyltransferase involved in cell wall biosynthesis